MDNRLRCYELFVLPRWGNLHKGHMHANGTELSLKSMVDLSCWLNKSSYRRHCVIVLSQNRSIISSSSSPDSSIRTQVLLNTFGRQMFECRCKEPRPLNICGIYVFVGIYDSILGFRQITNETPNRTVLGEKNSTIVHLGEKLDFETTYTVVVEATNKLGSNSSEPIQFTLIDIVPFEPVDVWYLKKETASKMQNITLFWKSVNVSGTISQNFHYQVVFQNLNQMPPRTAEMSVTTHTVFSHVSLKVDYNITLNSKNSRGVSPSVYITTKLGISELLPPNRVSATSMDNERIIVKWEVPSAPSSSINGYVVEWVEIPQDYHRNPYPTWFKIPVSNCTVIKEISKPAPQPFYIKNIEAGASYVIWMTASTNAGESPKGNEELIYIKKTILSITLDKIPLKLCDEAASKHIKKLGLYHIPLQSRIQGRQSFHLHSAILSIRSALK
ncbi:hypothetical protein L345_05003, partial [Ophiophagus hannah]